MVDAIRANPARQLLVGGTADRLWDADVATSLAADGCDVLQLDGLDHGLIDPSDAVRSAEALLEITRAMAQLRGRCLPLRDGCNDAERPGYPLEPGIPTRTPAQCRRSPSESSAMLARSEPWPSVSARLKEALTSFSASSRPTQLAPSTDLPGSSSL